jgi:hypothetical protein
MGKEQFRDDFLNTFYFEPFKPNVIKLFTSRNFTNVRNKLKCLSLFLIFKILGRGARYLPG